jgi:hypothetical protein
MAMEINQKRLHKHALPVIAVLFLIATVSALVTAPQLSAAKGALFSRTTHIKPDSNGLASFKKTSQVNNPIVSVGQVTQTELILESAAN